MSIRIEINQPLPPPVLPIEPKGYSKLAVTAIFLAAIPFFVLYTAAVILCLPLKAWNIIQKLRGKGEMPWVNALIQEYFTIIYLGIRYPFSKKDHHIDGDGKPILLVHGYLHNSSGWFPLINRLKEKGIKRPIYLIDLGDGTLSGKFLSIHTYAGQILNRINGIKEVEITIIGHSMGGLAALAAVKRLAPGKVSHIYTIATPLHGSSLAKYVGIGQNATEMVPGSEFLTGIHQDMPPIIRKSIGSKMDPLIQFHQVDVEFNDLSHTSLMTSNDVADQLYEWLKARCE